MIPSNDGLSCQHMWGNIKVNRGYDYYDFCVGCVVGIITHQLPKYSNVKGQHRTEISPYDSTLFNHLEAQALAELGSSTDSELVRTTIPVDSPQVPKPEQREDLKPVQDAG